MTDKKRRPSSGQNGATPGYDDKVRVANKITFFPRDEEKERVILMQPHVGKAGREIDLSLISYFEKYEQTVKGEGGNEMVALNQMGTDPEFYEMISNALDMAAPENRQWLEDNLTLLQWFEAFQAGMTFRMEGCIWKDEVQEALGKSPAEEGAAGNPVAS